MSRVQNPRKENECEVWIKSVTLGLRVHDYYSTDWCGMLLGLGTGKAGLGVSAICPKGMQLDSAAALAALAAFCLPCDELFLSPLFYLLCDAPLPCFGAN